MHVGHLDAIKKFEGFTAQAQWDYAQHSNGFGTKALFPGEVIDRAEADRRFSAEISKAEALVEKFAPGLDAGTKAALTSLTYNTGTKWMSAGLGEAVLNGDFAAAKDIFVNYNKAGGEVLPGLASRRLQEASWFAGAAGDSTAPAAIASSGSPSTVDAGPSLAAKLTEFVPVARRELADPTFGAAAQYASFVGMDRLTGSIDPSNDPVASAMRQSMMQAPNILNWLMETTAPIVSQDERTATSETRRNAASVEI